MATFAGPSSEPVDFNRGFWTTERRRSIFAAFIDEIGGWSIRHWLGPIGRSCLPSDGLLIGPAPSQSVPVQSFPQLRSKLLDEPGVRRLRFAHAPEPC